MTVLFVALFYFFYISDSDEKTNCTNLEESLYFVDTQYSCYDSVKGQTSFSIVAADQIDNIHLILGPKFNPKSLTLIEGEGNPQIRPINGKFGDPLFFDSSKTYNVVYNGGGDKEIRMATSVNGLTCQNVVFQELQPCTPEISTVIDSGNANDVPLPSYTGGGGGGGGGGNGNDGSQATNPPAPQCSDGVDNDGNDLTDWPNDPGCENASDDSEFGGIVASLGGCEDGIDNDGDSWTDVEDPDCTQSTNNEDWIGLSTCSDGIDNNRDGLADRDDASCNNALNDEHSVSTIGFRSGGIAACSDGIDNDNDGLKDYPYDAGCTATNDDDESSEIRMSNFNFTFGSDGFIQEINWTNSSGISKRFVWDELQNNRYGGGSGVRFYLHSTLNGLGGVAWSYKLGGTQITKQHQEITYKKLSQGSDIVTISVNDSRLLVNDSFRFYNNTVFVSISITNNNFQSLGNLTVPVYFGGLIIGNYPSNYLLNLSDTGISRLVPWAGGTFETNFSSNSNIAYQYPTITQFAPVTTLGDSRITVGQQYMTHITQPDFVELSHKAYAQYTPTMRSKIHIDTLEPYQTRTFVVAYSVADGGQWQRTLEPYKDWFAYDNGDNVPSYCPTGSFNDLVGSNAQAYYNPTTHRYLPNTTLKAMFGTDATRQVMQDLGFESFGLWETALNSACLIGDKNCSRTFIQECFDKGNIGGTANCEFSGNIDLIDPNIDAGRNKTKIKEFTDAYIPNNISIFWYVRPCGEIYGANISFDAQGNEVFTAGIPTGYADLDLRNVTNRDRQFARVAGLAQQGVRGFYYDATGCPGDEGFFDHVKKNLTATYGNDLFFLTEGAIDRQALRISQAPLIKNPIYSNNSSMLISYLVPQGTYYGGIFNSPLDDGEFKSILDKGYQAIPLNFPPTLAVLDSFWQGEKIGLRTCRYLNQSFYNRYKLWQSYGSDLGCAAPPQSPPPCPVN